MSRANLHIFADGEAAARKANTLRALDWTVVISGPNAGTDIFVEDGNGTPRNGGWVVLASKVAITPVP